MYFVDKTSNRIKLDTCLDFDSIYKFRQFGIIKGMIFIYFFSRPYHC